GVEARDKLKIARELDGQDPEIARYLESAAAEAPRAQALATAKAALARRDYAGVRGALAGIPDDSALAESAHDAARQLRSALDSSVREARTRAEAPRREREREAPRQQAPAPPAADVQSILEAYLAGDIGAAIERAKDAQSPRGVRLFSDLRQFDSSYKEGLARQQAHRLPEAVRSLETAAAADKAITGGQEGRLGREVRKALSALHFQLAEALPQADETLPQQAQHLRAAVQNDPANDAAQAQLRQLADRAKEIYLRGYV